MKKIFPLLLILCVTLSVLRCRSPSDRGSPAPLKIEQPSEYINVVFGVHSRVLYHNVDTERLPGLEEWIIDSPTFDLQKQALTGPLLRILDTSALEKVLLARIPNLKLTGVTHYEHGKWLSPKGKEIQCNVLYAGTSRFVYLLQQP